MSTQAIQEPQIPAAATTAPAADQEVDAATQAEAISILAAVARAKHDHRAGNVSREDYFLTVDDLGVAWRALFRGHELLGTHVPEEALAPGVIAPIFPALGVPGATMFAFVSDQGTAMSETALCARCYPTMENRVLAEEQARATSDWDQQGWHNTSGNEALVCLTCGRDNEGNLHLQD